MCGCALRVFVIPASFFELLLCWSIFCFLRICFLTLKKVKNIMKSLPPRYIILSTSRATTTTRATTTCNYNRSTTATATIKSQSIPTVPIHSPAPPPPPFLATLSGICNLVGPGCREFVRKPLPGGGSFVKSSRND